MAASYAKQYADVVFPRSCQVLGRRLHPPTIGHLLLLWRVGSPLVRGGVMGAGSLALALFILSRPWHRAERGMNGWWGQKVRNAWARQLRRCGEFDRAAAQAMLVAWLGQSMTGPELWQPETKGEAKTISAHFLQATKVRLMQCFGMTREAALNTPLREALWDLACYAEDQGTAEWVKAEDAEAIDTLLARQAQAEVAT